MTTTTTLQPLPKLVAAKAARCLMQWKGQLPKNIWWKRDGKELWTALRDASADTLEEALSFHRDAALTKLFRMKQKPRLRLPNKLAEHIAYAFVIAIWLGREEPFDLSPFVKPSVKQ